jgi:hypothetical protein
MVARTESLSTPRSDTIYRAQISAVSAGVFLAVGGWSGLIWLLGHVLPTVPNRWAFYGLVHVALTGTALPFVHLLHRRFSRDHAFTLEPSVLVRQANWVGLFGASCIWLRIPRLLSLPMAIVLMIALIIVESLLRLRERMQWRPE